MKMHRREFLAGLLSAGAYAQAAPLAEPNSFLFKQSEKHGFSILQGMTDHESAQFTMVLPKSTRYLIEVLVPEGDLPARLATEVVERDHSEYAVYKVAAEGLRLGATYRMRVRDIADGSIQDEREFRALDLSQRSVRLGFVSCANDHLHRDDVWVALEEQKPEMVFFLGDSVYADRAGLITGTDVTPETLWTRYVETRNRVAFYYFKRLIPVLALWDDHDFGGNNRVGDFEFKEDSREVFETFFAQTARPALENGPGIARRFEAFGAAFFLLDGRSFRDAWKTQNNRVLGDQQENWLFSRVHDQPTWLLNGSVFYGAYTGKDSFEGQYAADFKQFIAKLRSTEGLFAFGSGDVHFSEIMKIEREQLGYETFEMVSSSIHSYTFPYHEWRPGWKNARRVVSNSSHNFVIFEGEFSQDRIAGVMSSHAYNARKFQTPVVAAR